MYFLGFPYSALHFWHCRLIPLKLLLCRIHIAVYISCLHGDLLYNEKLCFSLFFLVYKPNFYLLTCCISMVFGAIFVLRDSLPESFTTCSRPHYGVASRSVLQRTTHCPGFLSSTFIGKIWWSALWVCASLAYMDAS